MCIFSIWKRLCLIKKKWVPGTFFYIKGDSPLFMTVRGTIPTPKFHQGANISANVSRTRPAVGSSIFPSTLTNLFLSTVLIWSSTICPFLPSNDVVILVGYFLPAVVIGAMMTVRMCLFISSGEIMRHGRVFLISCPRVGSRLTKQTSNLLITTAIPLCPIPIQFQYLYRAEYHLL